MGDWTHEWKHTMLDKDKMNNACDDSVKTCSVDVVNIIDGRMFMAYICIYCLSVTSKSVRPPHTICENFIQKRSETMHRQVTQCPTRRYRECKKVRRDSVCAVDTYLHLSHAPIGVSNIFDITNLMIPYLPSPLPSLLLHPTI